MVLEYFYNADHVEKKAFLYNLKIKSYLAYLSAKDVLDLQSNGYFLFIVGKRRFR